MRGVVSEKNADRGSECEGNKNRKCRDQCGPAQNTGDQGGQTAADDDADESADETEYQRFRKKLQPDVIRAGSNSHSDADLTRSLSYRNQHDIHDSDSADD